MAILILFVITIYSLVGVRVIGEALVDEDSYHKYESNFTDIGHVFNILFVMMTLNNYPQAIIDVLDEMSY